MEGDQCSPYPPLADDHFYPRPPGGGRPFASANENFEIKNFYPRPPGGGRLFPMKWKKSAIRFLSTPSGWRATAYPNTKCVNKLYFYPRPPGGGRPNRIFTPRVCTVDFYPRPPGGGRRWFRQTQCKAPWYFYPRPPGGGRPMPEDFSLLKSTISIHALRVEGDVTQNLKRLRSLLFLSTPSGWRATSYRVGA